MEQNSFSPQNSTPFGVCYVKVSPEQVRNYKMVIIEPDFYNKQEIEQLKTSGAKILAYMTLGEVDRNRWYFPLLEERGFLGVNEVWNSPYLDLADEKTRSILLNRVLPEIMIKGVDGIFLDTVDAVAPYTERKHLQPYMVEIIREIRTKYPGAIVMQNAGLFILDQTRDYIDAVLIEDIASNYDFGDQQYILRDYNDFRERISLIKSYEGESGKPFYIVDFAVRESSKKEIRARLDTLGYPYFISNIGLSELPENPDNVANRISE